MDLHAASTYPERRRESRAPMDVSARYMLADHPEQGWASCRVTDVSPGGAGMVLFGPPWPRYPSEWRLVVELVGVTSATETSAVPFTACVRNAGATEHGRLRVGVEFVALNAEQRDLVLSLLQRP